MSEEDFYQIESSQRQFNERLRHEYDIEYYHERNVFNLFALLHPKLFIDGDQYCVLLGDNIQDGICGFGDTPTKAIVEFNNNFITPLEIGIKNAVTKKMTVEEAKNIFDNFEWSVFASTKERNDVYSLIDRIFEENR